MEAALEPVRELLASITLAEYLAGQPPRTVVSIAASDPVGQVLRRFASARLVAAPCFADEQRSRYTGFLDLLDVVAAVVEAARCSQAAAAGPAGPAAAGGARSGSGSGSGSSSSGSGSGSGRCSSGGRSLRCWAPAAARRLAEQPVGAVRVSSNDAQLVFAAQLGHTLLEVVREGFAHPVDHLACHRLAVFQPTGGSAGMDVDEGGLGEEEEEGERFNEGAGGSGADLAGMALTTDGANLQVTNIVSQSDILCFLHKHRERLGQALLSCTLEQLGIREKRVLCVPADMAVIDALAGMVDNRVPAVAVIDSPESGRLIGNLSLSDLRGLQPAHFEQLAQPVGDFLQGGGWGEGGGGPGASLAWGTGQQGQQGQRAQHPWSAYSGGSPRGGVAAQFGIRSPEQLPREPALVVCRLGSRFGEALGLLTQRRLHRLFMVDGEGRPVGVVSLSDILRLVAG